MQFNLTIVIPLQFWIFRNGKTKFAVKMVKPVLMIPIYNGQVTVDIDEMVFTGKFQQLLHHHGAVTLVVFRPFLIMLNITNQEYALLSAEDRAALMSDDNRLVLTMTYENTSGDEYEYKFYQYYASSTDKLSTGKIFVVVNGTGEFYTTNDLVEKVMNDTSRVLEGLDIDAYGHN